MDLSNVANAHSIVVLTDSDTANLEVVLGARARNPDIPAILRVQEATFAESIARQFGITTAFSTSALAAPAFAGLSRFPGTRGRIAFGDDEYTVGERLQGEVPAPRRPPTAFRSASGADANFSLSTTSVRWSPSIGFFSWCRCHSSGPRRSPRSRRPRSR